MSAEAMRADAEMVAARGSCFGYTVRSSLPFRYLREGTGSPLEVREEDSPGPEPPQQPVMEWTSVGGQPFNARLYAQGPNRFSLWVDPMGRFSVDTEEPSVVVPPSPVPLLREPRIWGIPAALCFLARGDLPLHASAVDVEGSALLFAAPGHFGKTTLAAAFLQADHRILSEDLSCCRVDREGAVLPGPAVLRVRRDVYERLELPRTALVVEEPHRVHLALEDEARGNAAPVPLRGVVFLRRGQGAIHLERVAPAEAVPDLWTLNFKLPTDEGWSQAFRTLARLGSAVPVWNLYRRLEFGNLPEVVDRVVSTCLG
jgi:hypothetical protein